MIAYFDYEKLERTRENLRVAFDLSIGIYDVQGKNITWRKSIRSSLCHYMRVDNAEFDEKCRKCDREACAKCHETGKSYFYRCHAGLTEFVMPIYCENILVGYMITGQIIPADEYGRTQNMVCESLRSYGLDEDRIQDLFLLQPVMTRRKMKAVSEILESCVASLPLNRGITVGEDSLIKQIDTYIHENLSRDLTITTVCDALMISKTKLTALSRKYYGTSFGKHITNVRILESQRLLEETDWTIYDIASQIGIPDYNYFTKVFKTVTGTTPKDYRKQYLNRFDGFGKRSVESENS